MRLDEIDQKARSIRFDAKQNENENNEQHCESINQDGVGEGINNKNQNAKEVSDMSMITI